MTGKEVLFNLISAWEASEEYTRAKFLGEETSMQTDEETRKETGIISYEEKSLKNILQVYNIYVTTDFFVNNDVYDFDTEYNSSVYRFHLMDYGEQYKSGNHNVYMHYKNGYFGRPSYTVSIADLDDINIYTNGKVFIFDNVCNCDIHLSSFELLSMPNAAYNMNLESMAERNHSVEVDALMIEFDDTFEEELSKLYAIPNLTINHVYIVCKNEDINHFNAHTFKSNKFTCVYLVYSLEEYYKSFEYLKSLNSSMGIDVNAYIALDL
jgi:hypothetical protein